MTLGLPYYSYRWRRIQTATDRHMATWVMPVIMSVSKNTTALSPAMKEMRTMAIERSSSLRFFLVISFTLLYLV